MNSLLLRFAALAAAIPMFVMTAACSSKLMLETTDIEPTESTLMLAHDRLGLQPDRLRRRDLNVDTFAESGTWSGRGAHARLILRQLNPLSGRYFVFNARTGELLRDTVPRYFEGLDLKFGATGRSKNAINDIDYLLYTTPFHSCVFVRQFDGNQEVSSEHILGQAWVEGYYCKLGTAPLPVAQVEVFISAIGLRGFREP